MSAKEAPVIALLSRAHSPASVARIHSEKIQHKPLLLKPSEPTNTNPSARQQRHLARVHKLEKRKRKLKPAPLTAKEKRASKIYDIPKTGLKYEIFEQLHGMWEAYIREVLSSAYVTASSAAKLVSADYHGAELEVVRSKNVSRVGIKGIVVKDTRFTFEIITKNNVVKQVPKEGTVFRLEISPNAVVTTDMEDMKKDPQPKDDAGESKNDMMEVDHDVQKEGIAAKPLVFEIYGAQFLSRAGQRATRMPKPHYFPEL